MKITFAGSLFRLVITGISLTSILILITIWQLSTISVNKQLQKDLSIAQGVFQRISEERRSQLVNVASILTSDFGFKRAIATGDLPTIDSVLKNHGDRINADLMMLIDLDRKIETTYPSQYTELQRYPNENLIELLLVFDSVDEFIVINDNLYQVILTPIKAPNFIAAAGIAFQYDQALLSELKSIIQSDLIISLNNDEGEINTIASTFPDGENAPLILSENGASWIDGFIQNKKMVLEGQITLPNVNHPDVRVSIAQDVAPIYRELVSTQLSIIAITIIVMAFTLFVSVVFSKRLSSPVSNLVRLADRIADGDYENKTEYAPRFVELDNLTSALFRMRENVKQRESEIQFRAEHDMLTRLKNRSYLEAALDEKLGLEEEFQVIGISIIGFQDVNDLYGFSNADECLKVVASRTEKLSGLKSRLSGSDIVILTSAFLNKAELQQFQSDMQLPVCVDDLKIQVRIALGVIDVYQGNEYKNSETILRKLNIILEQARTSTTSVSFYEPEREQRYLRRLAVLTALKRTLASNMDDLFLVYQPKLDLTTGKVNGAEALIRWIDKELGFIPPDEFITLAEQAGLIGQISTWVMERAIGDLNQFKEKGLNLSIAINLSTQDIENTKLLAYFDQLIKVNGLKPSEIELEITESEIVADSESAVFNLQKLRKKGFQIAIDDFGTGYSSLAYIKTLPITVIKIDRCFVKDLDRDTDDQLLVKNTLELANSFGLKVVAEGVENREALNLLKEWNCQFAQGYFIEKPLSVDDFIEFMSNESSARNRMHEKN